MSLERIGAEIIADGLEKYSTAAWLHRDAFRERDMDKLFQARENINKLWSTVQNGNITSGNERVCEEKGCNVKIQTGYNYCVEHQYDEHGKKPSGKGKGEGQ